MPDSLSAHNLFLGEMSRTLDERFRFSLPAEWAETLGGESGECTLAKERPGCVSLWNTKAWQSWLDAGVAVIASKIQSGRLERRMDQVQKLGRLLSTRHRNAPIAGRGRVALPETFREFLGVPAGGEMLVVGAGVCVEIWAPEAWSRHIGEQMPSFRDLFEELAGN
ncbi:MAG: division/cell wall cluster transcriptional repressor MraZ [Planctomycetales bacterium]|nr:division/cell wall cluster transcriptional repressor MraZ [Planctomycetales bacterium]